MTAEVLVLDTVRTPVGRHGGALAGTRPDDLAAHVLRELLARNPALDPAAIGDVVFGNGNGAGEENRNVARMAALLAGLPTSVPGVTVNRLCGSGSEAVVQAGRAIALGELSLAVAGGVESMSRAPWVLPKPERPYAKGHAELASTTLGWRLVNPAMPAEWTVSLGEGAEILADKFGIDRERQDAFAARSHRLAHAAWERGALAEEVAPVPGTRLERDEGIRPDTTVERLAGLKPAFREGGTVTAGNSSPMNDGASAVLLTASEDGAIARVASRASSAVEPQLYGIGPVEAANKALERARIGWRDLKAVELNEAFAAQSLACIGEWDIDPERVNSNGGAIAIGHPLGASGGRILGTLAYTLKANGWKYGVAAICIGVGQGLAIVLEAV